jgi:hypothetical protein
MEVKSSEICTMIFIMSLREDLEVTRTGFQCIFQRPTDDSPPMGLHHCHKRMQPILPDELPSSFLKSMER